LTSINFLSPSWPSVSKKKATEKPAGAVVFRNDLLELIQYQPTPARVFERPVLICSSMVNKFYLSDLTPERSLFRFLVENGFQVFAVAWRNPTQAHAHWGISDYVVALLEAMTSVAEISGHETINLGGFCAGATITLAALSHLQAQGRKMVNSHSIMLHVSENEPDDTVFSVLMTAAGVEDGKRRAAKAGIVHADELTMTFNTALPEKLIWPYYVKNYLLGEEPEKSELMYWMNDQVNLPATLYGEFLDLAHKNTLIGGEVTVAGVPVDLARIDTETLLLGAMKDHITPWHAVYRTRRLLGGETTFLLSSGGHVTPMICPAEDSRERYYTNEDRTPDHEHWLAGATEHPVSWRKRWCEWLGARSGTRVASASQLGDQKHEPLAPAPGTYVLD